MVSHPANMKPDVGGHDDTPAGQPTANRAGRWRRVLLPVAAALAGLAMAGLALVLALAFAAFVAALVALALVGAIVTWALRTFVRRKRGETPVRRQ
ncbi:MAG: hypothetical protein AAB502_06660, partial [Chloroflexota bacterium]